MNDDIKIFCHRGLYGVTDIGPQSDFDAKGNDVFDYPPENSYVSIKDAFTNGFNVEVDVTMTKDNHIIVTHTNDLTLHSKDAKIADFVSNKTFDEIKNLKTGMHNNKSEFLTYEKLIELLSNYEKALINIEIKGTIGKNLISEPTNPSLIDVLALKTPADLINRIIWSSFAQSNIINIKHKIKNANIAQLFDVKKDTENLIYPDRNDKYLQLNLENINTLDKQIKSIHPHIKSVLDNFKIVEFCNDNEITIRTWDFNEKNPLKNDKARTNISKIIDLKSKYPKLKIDIITDYARQVREILKNA